MASKLHQHFLYKYTRSRQEARLGKVKGGGAPSSTQMDRKGGQEVSGGVGMWGEKRGERGKHSRRGKQAHSDRFASVSPHGSSVESLDRETKEKH